MANVLHLPAPWSEEAKVSSLPMMDLRHVRLIVAVLQYGSLTRSAEHLNLTQSALSHQLREIEDRLGIQLFLRVRRKLVPTDFCRAIVQPCREVLRALTSLEQEVNIQTGRGQTVRITIESYTSFNWLPPILKAFEQRYPRARVQVVPSAAGDVENALLDGAVDLAITTTPSLRNDVRTGRLFRDELLLVTAPGHPLSRRGAVTASDLRGERLIVSNGPAARRHCAGLFDGQGIQPQETTMVELTDTVISLVAAGLGVSVLPRWVIATEMRAGTVSGVRLTREGIHLDWLAMTRGGGMAGEETAGLIDLIGGVNAKMEPSARLQR
jgi:LysR family transcriptional regulator for metE and metH